VYHGLNPKKSMEWYLPRKKQSYGTYLDSFSNRSNLINKDEKGVLSQYFLKTLKYRQINNKRRLETIIINNNKSPLTLVTVAIRLQIRQRLFISEICLKTLKCLYDKELAAGILKYKDRSGNNASTKILPDHIKDMNIPVGKHKNNYC
jgi:hypothetical protein